LTVPNGVRSNKRIDERRGDQRVNGGRAVAGRDGDVKCGGLALRGDDDLIIARLQRDGECAVAGIAQDAVVGVGGDDAIGARQRRGFREEINRRVNGGAGGVLDLAGYGYHRFKW